MCFVGVGLPNIACNLAQRTVAPDLELVYESGVFGSRPARLPLSIGDPTLATGATAVTGMYELFAYFLEHPHEMPAEYHRAPGDLPTQVSDFIAGMTDRYALSTYERLFLPQGWLL